MFKVVPDQLRISDGWVRCGQCDEVFDANAHLYSDPLPARLGDAVDVSSVDSAGSNDWKSALRFDAPPVEAASPVLAESSSEPESVMPDRVEEEAAPAQEPALHEMPPAVEPVLEGHALEPALDALLELRPGHAVDGVEGEFALAAERPAPPAEPRYAQVSVKTVDTAETSSLSFMRQARAARSWQRVVGRLLLSLAIMALTVVLGLQLVVHERNRIAATEPRTKPFLASLCGVLGCTIEPVRQIDALVIDSSSFTKVRGDVYRLNVTLKSVAAIPLAVPALELTLTDMDDQAVVRRVLLASQLGFGKETMDAGAELSAAIPLRVAPGAQPARISGYRLLAFYP